MVILKQSLPRSVSRPYTVPVPSGGVREMKFEYPFIAGVVPSSHTGLSSVAIRERGFK